MPASDPGLPVSLCPPTGRRSHGGEGAWKNFSHALAPSTCEAEGHKLMLLLGPSLVGGQNIHQTRSLLAPGASPRSTSNWPSALPAHFSFFLFSVQFCWHLLLNLSRRHLLACLSLTLLPLLHTYTSSSVPENHCSKPRRVAQALTPPPPKDVTRRWAPSQVNGQELQQLKHSERTSGEPQQLSHNQSLSSPCPARLPADRLQTTVRQYFEPTPRQLKGHGMEQ